MADTSSSLSLPFIQPNQAQKHVTHNEALRILDVLTQLSVLADDQPTPPVSPTEGERYIVGDNGTDAWLGHDGDVALFENGLWQFFAPKGGWRAYVLNRETLIVHDGTDWIDLDSAELQEIEAFGLGMISLPATPFSAKLNAALWTALYQADGGDGSLISTVNKETSADDAGFIFQQDFATRALFGLFGSDNLRLATSADGLAFHDGLIVDAATGVVDQPNLPRFKGVTNFDNYLPADTWTKIAINLTEFNDQNAFDSANNHFVAPAPGSYVFGASLTFKQNASDQARIGARLVRNGVEVVSGSVGEITGPHVSDQTVLNVQTMVMLSAGDTLELQGHLRGFDGYFSATQTSLWGYKVG
ncbi:DUF2793 domain-containing protein [Roseobacter sp. YSTF-M11]|uniref:DUF2793 domain-containing protein n=1 Tax=Roseobacter insulae TaxID=2859783 RepID=A0A9X1K165_9RHOB|nr:DUF2793 domain-containing protein [Roseobacter insulae]MBW4707188.1 DUF2793 domain-containing protein [Roseobacter insulae]